MAILALAFCGLSGSTVTFKEVKVPFLPFLLEVSGPEQYLKILQKSVKILDKKSKLSLLTQQGNYPITIRFADMVEEAKKDPEVADDLGFAMIGPSSCEIVLNQDVKWNENSLKVMVFHEIGHCLGLDHPPKNGETIVMGQVMSEKIIYDVDSKIADTREEIKNLNAFYKQIKQVIPPKEFKPKMEADQWSIFVSQLNPVIKKAVEKEYTHWKKK